MTEETTEGRIAQERKEQIIRHLIDVKSLLEYIDATAYFHWDKEQKRNMEELIEDVQKTSAHEFYRKV